MSPSNRRHIQETVLLVGTKQGQAKCPDALKFEVCETALSGHRVRALGQVGILRQVPLKSVTDKAESV